MHSRINPFPITDKPKRAGKGGMAKRAALIAEIRKEEPNVLLLDAGDIWQGTPYFNFYGGELEFKLMSQMGYDAATLGNHDFDAGLSGLKKQLPHATFSMVNCNYEFEDEELAKQIKSFRIFERENLKIGVLGVGIELEGLVPKKLYGNTKYKDPLFCVNNVAKSLKYDYNCDTVICLSHLGYQYRSSKVSDVLLAKNSEDVDLIIGGHTHDFFSSPVKIQNKNGRDVLVNQVGWVGLMLGKIDLYFDLRKKKKSVVSSLVEIT